MRKSRFGFTLIELLVVIAIIGLLSTLAIIALTDTRKKARDGRRLADVAILQSALELYYDKNGHYPGSSCSFVHGPIPVCLSSQAAGDPYWIPDLRGYMSPPPEDPGGHVLSNHDQYIYLAVQPDFQNYVLFYMLEDGPQNDICKARQMQFFPGALPPEPPIIWSTKCIEGL